MHTVKGSVYMARCVKIGAIEIICRHFSTGQTGCLQVSNTRPHRLRHIPQVQFYSIRATNILFPVIRYAHPRQLQHQDIDKRPEGLRMITIAEIRLCVFKKITACIYII